MNLRVPVGPLRTLRRGSTGKLVETLQATLNALGKDGAEESPFIPEGKLKIGKLTFEPLEEDGVFGKLTRNAVKAFQRQANLEDDGVVGPLTWDALGFDATALKKKLITQALMIPAGMSPDGPTTHGASECGYFSAEVVALLEKNNRDYSKIRFSADDVLMKRAMYSGWDRRYYTEERGGSGLSPGGGKEYLKFLGLDGYRDTKTGLGSAPDPTAAIDALLYYMGRGKSSVMVSLPNFLGAGEGHWIAILEAKAVQGEVCVLIYDVSKRMQGSNRKNNLHSGEWMCWFPVSTLAKVFNQGGFRDVVTRYV